MGKITEIDDFRQTVTFECPKCKNTEAFYEIFQTRALDEAPTEFYTCKKCEFCYRV